ncbi:hypothetical protein BH09MYX1_BH09MYX1_04020 [soil metagenome]
MPNEASDPGVDRVQTYGYGDGVICESPQEGSHLGGPHPDPAVVNWTKALGHPVGLANGFSQAELTEQNGGIMIFPEGLVGADGNQNSHTTYPKVVLPANKVPTSVYVTGFSELALVTVWDTDAVKGQIAVFALRADVPESFSIPYFALPNEGGFKGVHLMGYIDLPDMKTPTAIAGTGNNGSTPGGHAIGNEFASTKDPTKNIATDDTNRAAFAVDNGSRWVASAGEAVVISRWENKATFIDLKPLFQFVRDAYFTTKEKFTASAGQGDTWAYTFDTSPEAKPVVVTTIGTPNPTAVRVSNAIGSFAKGLQTSLHAFVANVDGEVRMYDVSGFLLAAPRPVPAAGIKELAKVQMGKNITAMRKSGRANGSMVIASRGDRAIQWLSVGETAITIARTLRDARITDSVTIDPNARGPGITVGDFGGSALLNFRVGKTENNDRKPPAAFGCGALGVDADCTDFEFAGKLPLPGAPYYVGTTNVN